MAMAFVPAATRHGQRFCSAPQAAKWFSREEWHPKQLTRWLEDDHLQIKLPFADQTELLTDIRRHGSRFLVEAPRSLAVAVVKQLRSSLAINDV